MAIEIRLVDVDGPTKVHIDVIIHDGGDLTFSGYDLGAGPRAWFGDSDYEYSLSLGAKEKDSFLIALLQELYTNDTRVISKVVKILKAKGIEYEAYSF